MCAAGALLSILHKEGLLRSILSTNLAAPDDDISLADSALRRRREADMHFCVENLSELHLLGHLCVDSASMHALQIFQVHLQSASLSPDISKFHAVGLLIPCEKLHRPRIMRRLRLGL